MDVLHEHVERFNAGVPTGDFGQMVEHFADDAELVFEGVPVGPFHGREQIAEAYRSQPPDDLIGIADEVEPRPTEVVATYGWQRDGFRRAGEMRLSVVGDRIARLVVTFDPPADPAGGRG